MVTIIDTTDKKILVVLDTDATLPFSSIAKKLRLSREVVAYRVKNLEKEGIIKGYIALSHFAKTGLIHFKIYIKYGQITGEQRQQIVSYLASHPNTGWLATTEGLFDLMFSIRFGDIYAFEKFKDSFFQKFDKYFHDVRFAILTEAETKSRNYIFPQKNQEPTLFRHCDQAKEISLDETELKVLKAISNNSRASYQELAQKTRLTSRVIQYRRKDLEKKGIIVGYKIVIDYRKLNYLFFKCFVTLGNITTERMNTLRTFVRYHPNITYWIKTIGSWDLELEIEAPSIEEFYALSTELREKFADIIKTFDSCLVSKEHVIAHA